MGHKMTHLCSHHSLSSLKLIFQVTLCFLHWTHNRLLASFKDSPPEEHRITLSPWRKHLLDLLVVVQGWWLFSALMDSRFLHIWLFFICQLDLCLHFRKTCDFVTCLLTGCRKEIQSVGWLPCWGQTRESAGDDLGWSDPVYKGTAKKKK